jgi:tRNA(adenine34) deaminase
MAPQESSNAERPYLQPYRQPNSQLASKAASQLASQPDRQSPSQPVNQPVNQPLNQLYRHWMRRLLRHCNRMGPDGDIPVAAVVLDAKNRCIGWGSNRRHQAQDPLGHAELIAIGQAARLLGDWRLNHCTLVVTLEPCPMCAGALVQARMGQVVFGAQDPKRGALGGCLDLADHPSAHHAMGVIGGVEAEAASQQLRLWFRRRRGQIC